MEENEKTKFCKRCGEKILDEAVVCPKCGCQVESMNNGSQPQIVVNNSNVANANASAGVNVVGIGRLKDKLVAFFLCLFLGYFGAHKFYEGKTGMGILYLFTFGLCGIGWFIDLIILLLKPNPYYV